MGFTIFALRFTYTTFIVYKKNTISTYVIKSGYLRCSQLQCDVYISCILASCRLFKFEIMLHVFVHIVSGLIFAGPLSLRPSRNLPRLSSPRRLLSA